MNKGELVEAVAKTTGYPKSQVTEVLNTVIATIAKTVRKGLSVRLFARRLKTI